MRKREELSSVIDDCAADIVTLCETWLSSKVRDSEILECASAFNFYRSDRESRIGGGVLIAVSVHLPSHIIPVTCPLELVCACVRLGEKNVILCACYRPPNSSSNFCDDLHDALHNVIVRYPSSPIILGDFNFPDISWDKSSGPSTSLTSEGTRFINLCNDFNLMQLVKLPTRTTSSSSNLLDLILTTEPDYICSLIHLPGLSDHCMLSFKCDIKSVRKANSTKVIFDYKKANFDSINAELEDFWHEFLRSFSQRSVEQNWSIFKDQVLLLISTFPGVVFVVLSVPPGIRLR